MSACSSDDGEYTSFLEVSSSLIFGVDVDSAIENKISRDPFKARLNYFQSGSCRFNARPKPQEDKQKAGLPLLVITPAIIK
jgi:hypothetical protein